MNITTRTGLVGFFLALSALPISGAIAATSPVPTSDAATDPHPSIENRLARLTEAIRQRETLLPEGTSTSADVQIIAGFANSRGGGGGWGNGGGGFANARGPGGFVNGGGGGFANSGGFRNGGGFWNY